MVLIVCFNNTLIHLTILLRGDCDFESVQNQFCSYGGDLYFFVQYQCSSNLNSQRFALEIAFDLVDAPQIIVREYQVNRLIWRLT